MSSIWNFCKKENWSDERKIGVFLAANTILFGMLGIAVWGIISLFALKDISWMLCFAGYAAFAPGFLGGIIFLWEHDRTDLDKR